MDFYNFVLLCSSPWDDLFAAGRALRLWVRFGVMKLLTARPVLQFWIKPSTIWKAIPLQIRCKQSHATSGWYLCARGRFLRQNWLLNSYLFTSLLTRIAPFQVCPLSQCKAGFGGGAVHMPQETGDGLLTVPHCPAIFLLQNCVFHVFCRAFHALSLGSF